MPRLVALNRKQWNVGVYESPALDVPLDHNRVSIEFERNNWPTLPGSPPDNEVIRVTASLSFDGGQTWNEFYGAGAEGGDLFNYRTGELITHSTFSFMIPEPSNPNRQGRVSMEIRERLRTQIDFDITIVG